MAFKAWNSDHLTRFNSATSYDFLDRYEEHLSNKLIDESKGRSHKTFAPSAFRCDRRSWFRLRGVEPDEVKVPDKVLDFSAKIGTACHRIIQSNLKDMLGDDWIDVMEYVYSFNKSETYYSCTHDESGLETLISTDNPPVRFACDGIVRVNGQLYLLEIKSSEYSSWDNLTDPKPAHVDQVKCYCTLLHLDKVLFLYIDRQYGGYKCFEISVSDYDKSEVWKRFKSVMDKVESNLAPDPLPKGDSWCTPSMCPYYKKCAEYGR